MRILSICLIGAFVGFCAPAGAQTGANGYAMHSDHSRRSRTPSQPRPHRTNGRNDCGNGDCRGVNSPGFMGGAPGDF